MRPGQRSRTAESAAAVRAWHQLTPPPRVFDDPYALHLTNGAWRLLLTCPPTRWLISRMVFRRLRPIAAQVIARSRYTEDRLLEAMARGVGQYVIVGAGMDSFAFRRRDLEDRVRVFEVDHPATQAMKRSRLATQVRTEIPANLEWVPIDFTREEIAPVLESTSYRRHLPAFYSWLGTTHYLPPDVTLRAVRSISSLAAPESELVFDYSIPPDSLSGADLQTVRALERFSVRRGEPIIGRFAPDELHREVARLGFEVVEDLSGEDLWDRYFSRRADELRPTPSIHLARLRLATLARNQ